MCAYLKRKQNKKFGPNIKGPIESAETISALGITEVALANNHVFDFGIEGLNDTLKALDEAGISYFGCSPPR